MKFKKQFFTVLEIIIVVLLIGIGISLTSFKIKEWVEDRRFQSEVNKVVSLLQTAQELMILSDGDVVVYFDCQSSKEPSYAGMRFNGVMNPVWRKFVEKKVELSALKTCSFKKQGSVADRPFQIVFSLGEMQRGTLVLEGLKKDQVEEIFLKGYPGPIRKGKMFVESLTRSEENERLYPAEIYEEIRKKKEP